MFGKIKNHPESTNSFCGRKWLALNFSVKAPFSFPSGIIAVGG
jgi:hypothetical protein